MHSHLSLAARWYPKTLKHRMPVERCLENWLFDPSSLTAKLRQKCPELTVNILSEKLEIPLVDEQHRLGLKNNGRKAWIRIITLNCGQVPLIYARTVIPDFSVGNPWHSLKTLGHTPLGHVLFQKGLQQDILRSRFEYQKSQRDWPLLENKGQENTKKGMPLSARRCEFTKKGKPILLTEVFLPSSFPYLDD